MHGKRHQDKHFAYKLQWYIICLTNGDYISVTHISGRHMHDFEIHQATQAFWNWSSHTGWITPQMLHHKCMHTTKAMKCHDACFQNWSSHTNFLKLIKPHMLNNATKATPDATKRHAHHNGYVMSWCMIPELIKPHRHSKIDQAT